MQLANQREVNKHEISPSIHGALIDSLFEAPASLLTGLAFAVVAATLTALKTGEYAIWACVALLVATGAVRAFDLHRYQARKSTLSAAKVAQWKKRYQNRALIQ